MQSNKPAFEIREYFPIIGTIWRNQNAEGRVWYSAKVERRYKDGEVWKSTDSFSHEDALVASKVLDLAHTEMSRFRVHDREAKAGQREPGAEG